MVRIFSDSTCDLSKELIERYNITIIPLHIVLGDKEYRDGIEITQRKYMSGLMRIRQHLKPLSLQ